MNKPAVRKLIELLVLCAIMFGGAYAVAWFAGRQGWPTSTGLVFENRWVLNSWMYFPWADVAGMVLFMAVLPLAWEFRCGCTPVEIGLRAGKRAIVAAAVGLILAILIFFCARCAMTGCARFGGGRNAGLIIYWLLTAASEEVAFRGILQRRLASLCPFPLALAIATIAFAAWHGWPQSTLVLAIRAGAGLVFGLQYRFGGSLLPPIACHWGFNIAAAW